jgi:hypothetical protein
VRTIPLVPEALRQAIITISVWNDTDDPSTPPTARFLTSSEGGEPVFAGYAQGIEAIADSVLAFLIIHFS